MVQNEGTTSAPTSKFPLSLPSSHHLSSNALTTSSSESYLHIKQPIPPPPSQPSKIKPFILRSKSPIANTSIRGGSVPRESKKLRPSSLDNLLEPVVPLSYSVKNVTPLASENVPLASTSSLLGKKVKAVSNLVYIQRSSSKINKLSSTGSSSSLFGLIGGIDGDDGGLIKKTKKRSYREERKRKEGLSDLGSQESADRAERARELDLEIESKRWAGTFAMNRTSSLLAKGKGKMEGSPKKSRLGDATNRLSSSSIPSSPPPSPTESKSKNPPSSQVTLVNKPPYTTTSPFESPNSIISIRTPSKSKLRPSSSAASLTTPGDNQRGTGVKSSYRDDTGNFIGRNRKPGLAGRRPASSQELRRDAGDGENGYSSLQELLESSGFTDTRVITPIIPRTLAISHILSTSDPASELESTLSPSSIVDSNSSTTPTLRPKPSLLSIRNILNLWQAPTTQIESTDQDRAIEDEEEELLSEEDSMNLKIVEEMKERAVEWRDNVARESHEANLIPPRTTSLSRSPPLSNYRIQPELIAVVDTIISTSTSPVVAPVLVVEPVLTSASELHQLKRKKSTTVLDLGIIPFGRRPRKGLTFTPSNRKTSGTAKMEIDTFNAKPATVVFTRKDAIPTTRVLGGGSGSDSGGRRALRHALSSPNILTVSKMHGLSSSTSPLSLTALPPTPPRRLPELTYQSFEFDIRSYDHTTSTIEGGESTSSILSGADDIRREYDDEDDDDDEPFVRVAYPQVEEATAAARLSWKSSIFALPSLIRTRASSAAIGLGLTRSHDATPSPPPLPLLASELIAAATAVVQGEVAPQLLRKATSSSALRPVLTRGEVDWDWGGGIISGGVGRGIRPDEVYRGRF